jgi:putative addiction module component (TIGR02574 family)
MSLRDKVRSEALSLPVSERAELARELLESLDGEDADAAEAWAREIERRQDESLSGQAEVLDYHTVMAGLRTK